METLTTMETKTIDELKLMAVNRLPELLIIGDRTLMMWDIESGHWIKVHEFMWPHIVHLLEKKMDDAELNEYVFQWNSLREYIFSSYKKRLQTMHNSGFLKD